MALDPKEFSAVVKVRKGICYPDLINSPALRNLPKEAAEVEGWPTYYMPESCANAHIAARFVKNSLCVDCWRVRQGRDTIYPKARHQAFYKQRDPAPPTAANGAPLVMAAQAPLEPSKAEQNFLAKLAELRDLGKAADAVPGWTIGIVQSRKVSNPIFRDALQTMCDQLGIATRSLDADTFKWTSETEKQFAMRLVDCGLIEQVRTEMGITASAYHSHLEKSPTFAAMIAAAEPLALITLRDRATKEAAAGNDRLLKILEIQAPESYSNMSVEQMNAELERLLRRFEAQGLIPKDPTAYIRKSTGETIEAADLIDAEELNSDLVSA